MCGGGSLVNRLFTSGVCIYAKKKKKVVFISGDYLAEQTSKYHKCVFATELIFYYNLKNPMERNPTGLLSREPGRC